MIKREDNPDLCFYEFFKYILDVLRRPYELYEVAEKIRVVYAGAGSFNDIYLNSDESEFCFLRDNLYLQCHDAILKSRGAEGIFGQNDFYSGLIYDDKKIKVDFDNHKQNKIEKTDLEKILNGDVEHIKNIDMYEPINSKNKVPVLPINVKRMLLLYLDKRINNEELSSWAKVIYFRSSEYVSVALKDEKNGDSYENMWYVIKKLSTPEIDGKITPEIVKQYLKELHNYFHKKKWFQCKLGQIFGMKKTKPPLPIFDVANSYIDKNRITLTEILKEIGDEVGEKYVWFIIEFDAQGSIDKNITINDINQKIDSEKLGYYEISWDFLKKITSRLSVVVDCSLIGSKSKEEFLRERAKLDQKVRNWTGFLCELDFYIQDGEIWEIKGSDKALVERLTKTFSPLPIYLV